MCFHIARFGSAIFFGALLASCSTTPLDAVIAQDSGAPSGGSAPDLGSCLVPVPGRFVLKSAVNGLCLGSGDPFVVFGTPGFTTRFDADCSVPAQQWDLSLVGSPGVFSLRNDNSADFMDVRMAGVQNGTPVIIYPPNGLDNQSFQILPRSATTYELRPQHVPASCVFGTAAGAAISTCVAGDVSQAWQFERTDCL